MTKVRLSRDAANYIRRETEYLRRQNLMAARKFALAMKTARQSLHDFPRSGNSMHGLQITGALTLVVGDYLLDYLFDGDTVDVLQIRHGRMLGSTPDPDLDADLND